jgi:hypothetical protein
MTTREQQNRRITLRHFAEMRKVLGPEFQPIDFVKEEP